MEGPKMSNANRSAKVFLRHFGIKPLRQFLPDDKIREIAKKTKKMRDRKLSIVSYFWLLMMVQFDSTIGSLDDLVKLKWLNVRKELGLAGEPTPVTKQALSKRNVKTPVKIFEDIFKHLASSAQAILKNQRYKGLYTLSVLDASTLDLVARFISRFPGAINKSRKIMKAQARLHLNFNLSTGVPEVVNITGGRTNEKKRLKKLIVRKAEPMIFIFDLGYWCYGFFNKIHQARNYFVTRLKANCRPKKIKKSGNHDWLVKLPRKSYGSKTNIYRLVSVKIEGRKRYYYLTNLLNGKLFSPREIAELYKSRWQIEIFFRDLKHVLGLTKFISYSVGGIKIQIYAALIAYILIKLVMHESAEKYGVEPERFSFQRSVKVIRTWLQSNILLLYNDRMTAQDYDNLLLMLMEFACIQNRLNKEAQNAAA